MPLVITPAADWMTPAAFVAGGAIDERTTYLARAHGARCLSMWRESLIRFAAGRPITTAMLEQHNRQSLDHWAMARAAAMALAAWRFAPRSSEEKTGEKTGGKTAGKTETSPNATHGPQRRPPILWGNRSGGIPWGRR